MPVALRPQSAPMHLVGPSAMDRLQGGERLLRLDDLLKEELLHEVSSWWASLPIVGRARGRWVFEEPEGLGYPRQRARRKILDVPSLDDLDLPEEATVERHNKSTHFKAIKGPHLEQWKSFCLRSTNAEFQKVPEPDHTFGPKVWMRMFRKSHAGNLRPGALELIEAWQPASTKRQREALSELLWSFNDHLTARRGKTETKKQYGPKQGEQANINLIDPFASALGRPSSAPIAHAVQRKFEQQKKDKEAKMLAMGAEARRLKALRPSTAGPNERREVDTLTSSVPIKWAGKGAPMESSNQAQMRTVKPKDLALAIQWGVPCYGSKPPASTGMGRHLGQAEWHGDAMYPRFWPSAAKAYQPLSEMRRPHLDIPGLDKLKHYIN